MASSDVLVDAFERIRDALHPAVNDLSAEKLAFRPDSESNSIGWLVWHLTRIQDDHVAGLHGGEQIWKVGGWSERFALPLEPSDTGYGHSTAEVRTVRPEGPDVLLDYLAVVQARTTEMIEGLAPDDLDRVVDRRWEPPVTLGVRLVSVADDCLQHLGQAAYVRGLFGY